MFNSKWFCAVVSTAASLWICQAASAFAPKFNVSERFAHAGNIKIWNTDGNADRIGAPLVSRDFARNEQVEIKAVGTHNDLSTEVNYFGAAGLQNRNNSDVGFVIPDPQNAGRVVVSSLAGGLEQAVGLNNILSYPQVANDDEADLWTSIDLKAYFLGGAPLPPVGTVLPVLNGVVDAIPGMKVGTVMNGFSSMTGFTNPAPFTGDVYVMGSGDLAAVPEPALAGLSLPALLVIRRRRTSAAVA